MPNHALIIGRAQPVLINRPGSSAGEIILGGAAALLAQELSRANIVRPTLLTTVDYNTAGKATMQLIQQNQLLYRAIPCQSETPALQLDTGQPIAPQIETAKQESVSAEDFGHALNQTVADYNQIVVDCNLAIPILDQLTINARDLSIIGAAADRCIRIMATLANTKTVVALTQQQASTLQEGNQLRSVAELNESLRATYVLITGPWGQYDIYHQERRILQSPGLSNMREIHDYGVHEAAAAGLIAAVLTNNSDITKIMDDAIVARLRENAGLPPD